MKNQEPNYENLDKYILEELLEEDPEPIHFDIKRYGILLKGELTVRLDTEEGDADIQCQEELEVPLPCTFGRLLHPFPYVANDRAFKFEGCYVVGDWVFTNILPQDSEAAKILRETLKEDEDEYDDGDEEDDDDAAEDDALVVIYACHSKKRCSYKMVKMEPCSLDFDETSQDKRKLPSDAACTVLLWVFARIIPYLYRLNNFTLKSIYTNVECNLFVTLDEDSPNPNYEVNGEAPIRLACRYFNTPSILALK